MPVRPVQNELGQRAFEEICNICWSEWLKYQQQLINHYALNLLDPGAKQFLIEQLRSFCFAPKEELPQR